MIIEIIIIITVKYCLQLFSCQWLNHFCFPNHAFGKGSALQVHSLTLLLLSTLLLVLYIDPVVIIDPVVPINPAAGVIDVYDITRFTTCLIVVQAVVNTHYFDLL